MKGKVEKFGVFNHHKVIEYNTSTSMQSVNFLKYTIKKLKYHQWKTVFFSNQRRQESGVMAEYAKTEFLGKQPVCDEKLCSRKRTANEVSKMSLIITR